MQVKLLINNVDDMLSINGIIDVIEQDYEFDVEILDVYDELSGEEK